MVFGLCLKVEIYQDMVGSHLTFCIIFKLKHVFSFLLLMIHMLNNSHSIKYHGNNVQNPIRTYPIIARHYAIFHVLELYFTNQFHFAPLDFPLSCVISLKATCILSHIQNAFSNPQKKIHTELNGTDGNFSCNCYHGLNPIACQFIVNNLHFIMYFTCTGQSPDGQQSIKEPSLN